MNAFFNILHRPQITESLIAGKTTQRKKMINQLPKFKS